MKVKEIQVNSGEHKQSVISAIVAILLLSILLVGTLSCKTSSSVQIDTVIYPYEVSLNQANQIMGAPIPFPSYLPEGFEVRSIYALDHGNDLDFMVLLISDNTTANVSGLTQEDLQIHPKQ